MSTKIKTIATKEDGKATLTPKLRFSEFRDAEGWKERPLGDFLSESRLPGSKGNIAKKITVKLWGNGVYEKNDAILGSVNTQYFRRKSGQFIYSKLDFLNQAFGIIPPNLDNFESTVDLPCFDIADGLNSVFLLEYVKRKDFYARLGETADGSRKARRIHADTFLSFPIYLPTLVEQQKIAECLSSVDELIAAEARNLDALKTHKKGLMQQLFPREGETQPRLRFPEFQTAGEWEVKKLGQIAKYTKGFAFKSQDYKNAGVRIIRVSDLGADFIKPNNEKLYISSESEHEYARYKLTASEIIVTTVGSKPELVDSAVGRGIYVNSNNEGLLNQNLLKLEVLSGVNSRFLFSHINTPEYQRFIASISRGNANQANIAVKDLMGFMIKAPRHAEQQRIADCLTSLDDLIAAQTQKLSTLKTHKKGLMQQLFPSPEEVEA